MKSDSRNKITQKGKSYRWNNNWGKKRDRGDRNNELLQRKHNREKSKKEGYDLENFHII